MFCRIPTSPFSEEKTLFSENYTLKFYFDASLPLPERYTMRRDDRFIVWSFFVVSLDKESFPSAKNNLSNRFTELRFPAEPVSDTSSEHIPADPSLVRVSHAESSKPNELPLGIPCCVHTVRPPRTDIDSRRTIGMFPEY